MKAIQFKAEHINATTEDFLGNGEVGRYIFFPGSDGRARKIAESFSNPGVKQHARGHAPGVFLRESTKKRGKEHQLPQRGFQK